MDQINIHKLYTSEKGTKLERISESEIVLNKRLYVSVNIPKLEPSCCLQGVVESSLFESILQFLSKQKLSEGIPCFERNKDTGRIIFSALDLELQLVYNIDCSPWNVLLIVSVNTDHCTDTHQRLINIRLEPRARDIGSMAIIKALHSTVSNRPLITSQSTSSTLPAKSTPITATTSNNCEKQTEAPKTRKRDRALNSFKKLGKLITR